MNSGNPPPQSDYKERKLDSIMKFIPLDLNLLNDPSDSRFTAIHAKVRNLTHDKIDLEKVKLYGYSKDSLSDWLKGRHPIPFRLLKDAMTRRNRKSICRNSKRGCPVCSDATTTS